MPQSWCDAWEETDDGSKGWRRVPGARCQNPDLVLIHFAFLVYMFRHGVIGFASGFKNGAVKYDTPHFTHRTMLKWLTARVRWGSLYTNRLFQSLALYLDGTLLSHYYGRRPGQPSTPDLSFFQTPPHGLLLARYPVRPSAVEPDAFVHVEPIFERRSPTMDINNKYRVCMFMRFCLVNRKDFIGL